MSRAKKTKVAKKRSALGLYRQVDELLKRKPKPSLKSNTGEKDE